MSIGIPGQTKPRRPGRSLGGKLTYRQILQWADEHFRRTGGWPHLKAGPVIGGGDDTWGTVDRALRQGLRGLPGGSTLSRLLAAHRSIRRPGLLPPLNEKQILRWADAFHARTGRWPYPSSGRIPETPRETWGTVNYALRKGIRGLANRTNLGAFLGRHHRQAYGVYSARFCEAQILDWAKAHYRREGSWPKPTSGSIPEAPAVTWSAVNAALRLGNRGLPGGSSLVHLLSRIPGFSPHRKRLRPELSVENVVLWARAHHRRTGEWPTGLSGPVHNVPGETWCGICSAMKGGSRGFPPLSSLARLLDEHFPDKRARPYLRANLTAAKILRWAKEHYSRTDRWPKMRSGPVVGHPGESWHAIQSALQYGWRGLPGGDSLSRLLHRSIGDRADLRKGSLTTQQIRRWALVCRKRSGKWPAIASGAVAEAPGETWRTIDGALRAGCRGLPGGSSLHRLLSRMPGYAEDHRRATKTPSARRHGRRARYFASPHAMRKLSCKEIMMWAKAHYRRLGEWPERYSGRIPDAAGETWLRVDDALAEGTRGLPGRSSLTKLLARKRPPSSISSLLAKSAGRRGGA